MVAGVGLEPTDTSITVPWYIPRAPRHKSRLAGTKKSTVGLVGEACASSLFGEAPRRETGLVQPVLSTKRLTGGCLRLSVFGRASCQEMGAQNNFIDKDIHQK